MQLLKEIIIIFAISIIIIYLFNKIKIPSIVGFLITGIIAGPYGFSLVSSMRDVEVLSEIGVILLLFTIGLEFSLKNLVQIKRSVLLGGALQVFLTISVVFFIARFSGEDILKSIFFGFFVSLSSTAIVLKIMQDRSSIETPCGRSVLSILIFQDIIAVPMLLLIPIISGTSDSGNALVIFFIKSLTIILLVILSAKVVLPWIFYHITKSRSRELFLLGIIVICFSTAWFTYSIGLSLAIGAFLAGLVLSETEYSHEAIGNIVPFRDIFTSLFFISIGMLLNITPIGKFLLLIIVISLAVMFVKFLIALISMAILGLPIKTALLTGLAVCQIGEFSFIILKSGFELNLLSESIYQIVLAVSVITMIITPFIIAHSERIADLLLKLPMPDLLRKGYYRTNDHLGKEILRDHLVIVGFGVNGRNVARSAGIAGVPYIIIEMNPDTVRNEKRKGESIIFGDASHEDVLKHADIDNARVIVITVPDAAATRRIVSISKKINPVIHIIARTRYVQEVPSLYDLGADEVIPEEFETSIEIFTRVLMKYNTPYNDILSFIDNIRLDGYKVYRSISREMFVTDLSCRTGELGLISYRIEPGSIAVGKTISELNVRRNYGISIIGIYRGKDIVYNPSADAVLFTDDILLLLGGNEDIKRLINVFIKKEEGMSSPNN